MPLALVVLAVLVLLGVIGWLVGVHNGLVQLRNDSDKAWANIDVLLQQRHDELTKLLDAVSG